MAQPPAYVREFNFSNWQANNPSEPVPAPHIDAELNRIKAATDHIRAKLAILQRDDGALANGLATYDALSTQVKALLGTTPTDLDALVAHMLEQFVATVAALGTVLAKDVNGDPVTAQVDTTLTANSDLRLPTQKAVKAYVDALANGGTLSGVNIKSNSLIVDNTDATKKLAQDISSFSTGVTRTVIWPDSNGTVTLIDLAQRLRNKSLEDVSTAFVATADNTKKVRMDVSAVSPSTTRIVAWPDANVTISAYAATLLDDADAATARTTLNVQTLNSKLTAISGLTVANGKFIRWTSATTCVAQDIVGTVSQSSGVPTGAIIERGSNANGEYVRYADGTQICTATLGTSQTCETAAGNLWVSASNVTWTFPIAFAAAPIVSGSVGTVGRWLGIADPTTTSVDIRQYAAVTSAVSQNAKVTAIGRWF